MTKNRHEKPSGVPPSGGSDTSNPPHQLRGRAGEENATALPLEPVNRTAGTGGSMLRPTILPPLDSKAVSVLLDTGNANETSGEVPLLPQVNSEATSVHMDCGEANGSTEGGSYRTAFTGSLADISNSEDSLSDSNEAERIRQARSRARPSPPLLVGRIRTNEIPRGLGSLQHLLRPKSPLKEQLNAPKSICSTV